MKLPPLFSHGVSCGFPSPADDHKEASLSLDQHLITSPAATFLARANGDSMQNLGIFDRDLLVVDRSLAPVHGDVVVVALDGQLTCKVLDRHQGRLLSANDKYKPIPICERQELIVEGVVKASIRYHRPC
ncbi:DNA polymerase V [Microbulbifer sp. A4B17]|uniref:LexA family protein n=1 Tax=Microbulbifer sp. A4B17 TaxID=359370 RepID=UPI000D52E55F|nr:translesion error-prone DNA polymerase V autoproteolytic subunit [Microbulbifer sp. A4B17]AWF83456.1 DNA polymerase V [Microbulbifer sp. A4B17]